MKILKIRKIIISKLAFLVLLCSHRNNTGDTLSNFFVLKINQVFNNWINWVDNIRMSIPAIKLNPKNWDSKKRIIRWDLLLLSVDTSKCGRFWEGCWVDITNYWSSNTCRIKRNISKSLHCQLKFSIDVPPTYRHTTVDSKGEYTVREKWLKKRHSAKWLKNDDSKFLIKSANSVSMCGLLANNLLRNQYFASQNEKEPNSFID